jgi:DNA-binding transcriptional LysR family regulator
LAQELIAVPYHQNVELRQIRYFVAVAEELHFRNAAKKLRIAQPSVSLQIRLLEEELNVPLFERTNRKVTLTPAGTLFLERCKAILEAIQSAGVDTQKALLGEAGRLNVGFSSTASFAVLPRFLKRLAATLPQVECRLTEQPAMELFQLLEARTIDLAFLHSSLVPSIFMSQAVDREELQAVLPRNHKLARQESVKPAELRDDVNFLPEPQASQALYEAIHNVFNKHGGFPARTQTVEQVQTAISLVANGLGVVLAPESTAQFLPRDTVLVPLEPRVSGIVTLAVWRRDDLSPLLARVVKLLAKTPGRGQ